MSSTDEVTAQHVTEFKPDSVIYNIEEYNRIYVMQLGSGEDPKPQNTLKNASCRGGRAAN